MTSTKFEIRNSKFGGALLLLLLLLFVPPLTHAAATLEVGIPGVDDPSTPEVEGAVGSTVSGPVQYIKFMYLFALSFVGIAGFVTLVIWGTVWIASSIVDQKARAIEGIKGALIGIAIAFSAYLILYTINPDLTVIRLPQAGKVRIEAQQPPQASLICCAYVEGGQLEGSPRRTDYEWRCAPTELTAAGCGINSRGIRGVTAPNEQCERSIPYSGLQCNPASSTTRLVCCAGGIGTTSQWACTPKTDLNSECNRLGLSVSSARACGKQKPPQCQ